MVELRADDDDALAFGFDPGNDLALGHGGAESRHEDLPDLRSNSQDSLPWVFGGKGQGRKVREGSGEREGKGNGSEIAGGVGERNS